AATVAARNPWACTTSTGIGRPATPALLATEPVRTDRPALRTARRVNTARASYGVGLAGISTATNRAPMRLKPNWSSVAAGPQTVTAAPPAIRPRAREATCCPTPPVLDARTSATPPAQPADPFTEYLLRLR